MNEKTKKLMLSAAKALASGDKTYMTGRHEGCRSLNLTDEPGGDNFTIVERPAQMVDKNSHQKELYQVIDQNVEQSIGYFDIANGSWHSEEPKQHPLNLSDFEEAATAHAAGK